MTDFAREYGEGLYDLAREEHLEDELLQQLNVLREEFDKQPDFLLLLSNRALGIKERLSILDNALSGQVHPYLLNFLKILCQRDALQEFRGCVQVYVRQYNEDSRVASAQVTTAAPLTQDQKERLIQKLKDMTGRKVVLTEKLDPSLLGGVVLEMDGRRWDNTVRRRLNNLRDVIAGEA